MNNIIEKMLQYNEMVDKQKIWDEFFNNDEIPVEKKHSQNDKYQAFFIRFETLQREIAELGYTFKQNDMQYGIGRW